MMLTPLISVCEIDLHFRVRLGWFRAQQITALEAVSLDIFSGESIGIVGRNGSGKSTLLRVIAGIYDVDAGTITRNVGAISLMSLSLGLDGELSGRDNAIFGAMLLGSSNAEATDSLNQVLEFSELGPAFENPVKTYSSGMYSRLVFSISLFATPEILLVDEVLAVGDEAFRAKAYQALSSKITSGQTAVLVSHSKDEVMRLCDRVIILDGGRIVAEGPPEDVMTQYSEGTS